MSHTFWTTKYGVGNAEVDRQHEHIVELVNSLEIASESGHGAASTDLILTYLQRYLQSHFVAEERSMEAIGYPELQARREQHAACAKALQQVITTVESGEATAVGCVPQLRQWLDEHLLGTDQHYAGWLKSNPERVQTWEREIARDHSENRLLEGDPCESLPQTDVVLVGEKS